MKGSDAPMNVLLIYIDTLRADHLSCYGYHRETSPGLDALAAEGVLFERLYCPAIPTQPSYTTLYTGQHSITHSIVTHGGTAWPNEHSPWLTEILQQHGYTTCAVDNLYSMKPWFVRGYEFYIDPSLRHPYRQAYPCEGFNQRAIPWLKQHADEPFFLFVHYWDPHTPYLPPEQYRGLYYQGDPTDPRHTSLAPLWHQPFGEWWQRDWFPQFGFDRPLTDAEFLVAMYDAEIRYVDDAMAALLEALEATGVAEETLVIVTSDHGEEMYEHEVFFDHHGLYEGNIHAPLIVHWPGKAQPGRRIPHLVQSVDLAPTVLDALGIEVPDTMEGHSLVPYLTGERNEPIYDRLITQECTWQAAWAIRTDEYKLILYREPGLHGEPMRELYDLRADPGERQNLAGQLPDVEAKLEAELEGWIQRMMAKNNLDQDPLVAQGITLGKEWKDWVKEKGYW
ncbi:MAG TPA: DUF4976 domain-containing protein [Anaerolineae bacterium]|nr:DUF4976 domain-containing protein [Anaerolineae bacterium]HIQ06602.1 DUF4976 domain-containing protein [Anaerolineae bacterium]